MNKIKETLKEMNEKQDNNFSGYQLKKDVSDVINVKEVIFNSEENLKE